MKALFSRFNRGLAAKDKDREPAQKDKEKPVLSLPPLPQWPPGDTTTTTPANPRPNSTPNSISSFKPLPDLAARPLPPIEEPSPTVSSSDRSISKQSHKSRSADPSREDDVPTSGRPSAATMSTITGSHLTAEPEPAPPRSSRKAANGAGTTNGNAKDAADVQKKVAFISPPPTPGPSADRHLPDAGTSSSAAAGPVNGTAATAGGSKSNIASSRFQGKDTRGSTSTAASSSRVDVVGPPGKAGGAPSIKATSTRAATSPYPASVRSGTPYSQMSNSNASSRILAVTSWSEGAEDDLVSNLGPRERTRQEVLWEIVASEERYVNDLQKMKDSFIDPLLHPFAPPAVSSTTPYMEIEEYRLESPQQSVEQLPIAARFMSPTGFRTDGASSSAAANAQSRATPAGGGGGGGEKGTLGAPTIHGDGDSLDSDEEDETNDRLGHTYNSSRSKAAFAQAAKHNHPRSPYRGGALGGGMFGGRTSKGRDPVPFPSRSHHSLPPPPRGAQGATASTTSLGRASIHERERERERERMDSVPERKAAGTPSSRVLRKVKRSQGQTQADALANGAVYPHQMPEDLRICLEVIESGVLEGHVKLSEGLRKRYEEQYPLVRSLADVFVSNSALFKGYATYVLHLERALEQVDNALSTASASKKPKNQDSADWLRVCKYLQRLEEGASDKGETGLAISLSKPFQRLLKYPLLFQNLLYHTDPSTFEYESTLQMVAEVETIVRSIEDEKIQKEDRDRTRDVFARIEGLDKVRQLAVPKPSRLLLEERPRPGLPSSRDGSPKISSSAPPPAMLTNKNVKGKSSFRRLSDVLGNNNGIGGKKDLWEVVFNDVILVCQRTGQTSLPLVSSTNSRTNSMPDLQGKAKYASQGRRTNQAKQMRNLYKFLKIEQWVMDQKPKEGVVSMADVVRSKNEAHSSITTQPRIVPLPDDDDDDGDSDDSDKKSKMSFSYWGADKVTLQKPVLKPKNPASVPRRSTPGGPSYGRESSANAKFGNRLLSPDHTASPHRPGSRRTQTATPSARSRPSATATASATAAAAAATDDSQSMKATVSRPAWDTSTRAASIPANASTTTKRPRQTSQTSTMARPAVVASAQSREKEAKPQVSPAASEDSGVGLYRQLVAQDPSLNQ
ncbi:Dbl-like domain-containing protein [Coniophora puteana RWD-64-598 SS2]|uniref:Dbl-like domain-containing protein n=1 Tax=Coniophora puteana (strain RWD-64-598) TaxID=741705 RepID=A0A5M3N0W0_CONPW|nr:Dbl-like domain-containing protein [Coniophora puteana RWD-64-598 SS2]EIW85022.1 Dbl-like domain-containing protein [Coniophora puteana RWD-64-598 SS2]